MRQLPLRVVVVVAVILVLLSPSLARDTINISTSVSDGQTLISDGRTFELGFFSPSLDSPNRYLGIWYHQIPVKTIIWVANRRNPVTNSTGILKISKNRALTLVDSSSTVFWSSSSSNSSSPIAQLLDNGNLVLRSEPHGDDSVEIFEWQSFDYPTDTLLPGMKLGRNVKTGLNRNLTAWKSSDDPSPSAYTFMFALLGLPEFVLYHGPTRIYRSGPWNGVRFSGVPELISDNTFKFSFISNDDEQYYTYNIKNQSVVSRLLLSKSGTIERRVWLDNNQEWHLFWSDPKDQCDNFAQCGVFGVCDSNRVPFCECLQGFEPKSRRNWDLREWSDGCMRRKGLDCKGDGFLMMENTKLPETRNALVNTSMSLDECNEECSMNCSCMAYASANISGEGSGCIIWVGNLIDLRVFENGGQDLYIRLAASELGYGNSENSNEDHLLVIIVSVICGTLFFGLCGYFLWTKNMKNISNTPSLMAHGRQRHVTNFSKNCSILDPQKPRCTGNERSNSKDFQLPLLDIATIMAATEDFAIVNKLGEGGFGPVYKGKLADGQDIAVKRLSKKSLQGLDEFKNEVMLIAKLQHRNLVRLLGCCIHQEELLLIYEYMHNRSLDTFIFDKEKYALLNWQRRFTIILGIARGLLYLHQDSRFRIIHRDLKASNVLLDIEMNPKISDFGMARIFKGTQTYEYTQRVTGTCGYMSPEYAMDGIFSMKSDVYSFGVLILEIVSGKRNRGFYHDDPYQNLHSYMWRIWKEGQISELLVGLTSDESCAISEVLRCVQVGLLCVQELARDRPMMSSVAMMLGSETVILPEPKEPRCLSETSLTGTEQSCSSMNGATMTVITAR